MRGDSPALIGAVVFASVACTRQSVPSAVDDASYALDADAETSSTLGWARRYGGADRDFPIALTVDTSRELFVATSTSSSLVDFGAGSIPCDAPCIVLAGVDARGRTAWSRAYAPRSSASAVAFEADVGGGLFLAGNLFADADLGGPGLVAPSCTSVDRPDAYVARLDVDGYTLWAKRFGDCDVQTASALAIDGTDAVLAGTFQSTIDFGLGPLHAVGARDVFLARLDAGGSVAWSKGFGGVGSASVANVVADVAVDSAGEAVTTGSFEGTIDFGGGASSSAGGADVFVAKLDAAGNHVWSARFGDGADQRGLGVAIDPSGDVVVTGRMRGRCDFGGGELVSDAGDGAFVVKLRADGAHVWSKVFGANDARPTRAAFDAQGDVLLCGEFSGVIDFGGGSLDSGGPSSRAMFLAKLDRDGAHLWSRAFGGASGSAFGAGIVVDSLGDAVVLGGLTGTLDLGAFFGTASFTDEGGGDVFLAKLAP